jgi:hypothetical protein
VYEDFDNDSDEDEDNHDFMISLAHIFVVALVVSRAHTYNFFLGENGGLVYD